VGTEGDSSGELVVGVTLDLFIVDAEGLGHGPVADGAVRVGADGLLKGAVGFVVPEIEDEVDALVEPGLGLGVFGADGEVEVADAGELLRGRELFRGDGLGLRRHGVAGRHLHLGGCGWDATEAEGGRGQGNDGT
jgi:hypothetical protein